MKVFITALNMLLVFASATPMVSAGEQDLRDKLKAWIEWYNKRDTTGTSGSGTTGTGAVGVNKVETAAQSINTAIVGDAGGDPSRYSDYSRRLALTLNEKSKAELQRVFDSSNTLGLGS